MFLNNKWCDHVTLKKLYEMSLKVCQSKIIKTIIDCQFVFKIAKIELLKQWTKYISIKL